MVAVYSAHPTAPLSLHARVPDLDAAGFRALDGMRLPAMRGSIHLLPRETAHLAFRAVPEAPAQAVGRLRYAGVSQALYRRLRGAVLAAAAEPRTVRQLADASGAGRATAQVVGALAREGVLVRVGAEGLRSNALRYVAAEVEEADADEALAWLAGEYLRAFGPARPRDFAWWTGAPAGRARRALESVETEALDDGLLLPVGDRRGFEAARRPRGTVDLLPKWDCYTMGYAPDGRTRLADPDVLSRCYESGGDGRPLVLVDGAAAGAWSLRPGRAVEVDLELFEEPGPRLRRALAARVDAVRALLDPLSRRAGAGGTGSS